MRFSIVINTYNRGEALRAALESLRYQNYRDFEVVVVNGPSTDSSVEVVREWGDAIVAVKCPVVKIAVSRNLGIDHASGDVVCFMDDDALADPRWLEELAAGYDAPDVAGAGGIVWDYTGFKLQYKYSCCSRLGFVDHDLKPPFDQYNKPDSDPFPFMLGTNSSFTRKSLEEIDGFDEEIEYFHDETDVACRIIDLGYRLNLLPNAAVHHKYLKSHLRTKGRITLDPYPAVKNSYYFAFKNGSRFYSREHIIEKLGKYADTVRNFAIEQHKSGLMTPAQFEHYMRRADQGQRDGLQRGEHSPRQTRKILPRRPENFKRFPVLVPPTKKLVACFVSAEYPPHDFGGIGRFTCDLAEGFAGLGHEVHVVTRSPDENRVDFENGVWMHRLKSQDLAIEELDEVPSAGNFYHLSRVYREVSRIQETCPLDVVSSPLWGSEGLACTFDDRFPTVLTLMTSLKTITSMHPTMQGNTPQSKVTAQQIDLERYNVQKTEYIHAISGPILEGTNKDYGPINGESRVVHLGIRDRSKIYRRSRPANDKEVRVLFVGRLERRKGVDTLLEAAAKLCPQFPTAHFVICGKDTPYTDDGRSYKDLFVEANPKLVRDGRVTFTGHVTEEELYQHYADADVFVLPSRYESFGLVLLEAMVYGVPVVGMRIGGMQEIVIEGDNGYLAEPGDPVSLADKLRPLLGDADLRRRMGRRSREIYDEKFSASIMVDNTVRFYEHIANQHRRRHPKVG